MLLLRYSPHVLEVGLITVTSPLELKAYARECVTAGAGEEHLRKVVCYYYHNSPMRLILIPSEAATNTSQRT
jgi:hypothetical protein